MLVLRVFAALCLWVSCMCLLAGCGKEPGPETSGREPAPAEVSLLLNWFPEAEHGGFFAAQAHGFYEEEGLRVNILPGGPGASVVPRVATGAVEFGVENADHVLLGRAQQAPVVAVMAPIQTHPRCIMVHEESGIMALDQLRDITLAMNIGGAFSHYLKKHVALEGVQIVPYPGNVSRFVTDMQYAQQAYVFSEPYLARQQGASPRSLLLSEIGFNPYTSCLLTNEEMIETRGDIVHRMVTAAVRGWRKYVEDPSATHRLINELNPEMDLPSLQYGWGSLRDLVLTEDAAARGIGHMTLERWQELHDQLVEIELVPPGKVDPHRAFATAFGDTPAR
jgi:NitT/TauT family transport system substrate-binding protein